MTMAVATGRTDLRECLLCHLGVIHTEVVHLTGDVDGPHWSAERHTAPCGLPCIGGGVGSEVIKPMRAAGKRLHEVTHGSLGGPCSACGFVAPGAVS